VYQVYGLTETTAVCTIDREDPSQVVAGRVGFAIDGVELRRDETGEILARGPNIFAGYWRNPQATARVLSNGWLRTGDHGDVDAHGNWRVDGRVDSLIVRPNGHKVAPERLEELLASRLPSAQHVVGGGRWRERAGGGDGRPRCPTPRRQRRSAGSTRGWRRTKRFADRASTPSRSPSRTPC
jgi:long-chain acyl-CoA synthetase